ncbi:MAG TPA: YabP/YqfC family sporulation protein [Clostridia bacterium]|nr:YabP/YqfC family sporulation protein [Clostridia bacterium]
MRNYYDEMLLKLGLPVEDAVGLKVTVCSFRGVFIEGHKGLLVFTNNEILLKIGKEKLKISGADLKINEVSSDEIYIRGDIKALEVVHD